MVECFSSHAYADRPVALTWEGERLPVAEIEASWREPYLKRFRVRTEDGRVFMLNYFEKRDSWEIELE